MLLLHHDTFLFIPITSDSDNFIGTNTFPRHVSFERGTGQSLESSRAAQDPERTRRGSSLPVYGKTQYTAQDPERIAAQAIGYPQGEMAAPRHAAEKGRPMSGQPF